MADVITSQPESVAVAAAPAWAAEIRKYAVEAIGAFFLTFVVVVSVLSHSVFTPLAAGATLMVMIYAGGHISGGHYNPAVTMGALVRGRIGIGEAVGYWIAQVVGGVVAAVIGRAVVNPPAVSTLTLTGHTEAAAAVAELLKFYTTEGNYDLVGNDTPVFFIKDPIHFQNFIRSQKRLAFHGGSQPGAHADAGHDDTGSLLRDP